MKHFRSSHPIHVLSLDTPPKSHEFAAELRKVARPPSELWVQGSTEALSLLSKLPARGLSIVGSRECQARSLREISVVLSALKGFDLIVLSGLARGVDAHAHACAIKEGMPTIAVLGCGIDFSYPEENDELRHQILDAGGLVVSEFPRDAPARAGHFIQRNRLIAGWASATWVVEAGLRSGAINTATWTKQQDRPCFVTPCYPGDPTLEGNQRLLESREVIEGQIRPLWNVRSLGEVWLELESFLASKAQGVFPLHATRSRLPARRRISVLSLQEEIYREVARLTAEGGGASVEKIAEWGELRGFELDEFYRELRILIQSGTIVLQTGGLSTSSHLPSSL